MVTLVTGASGRVGIRLVESLSVAGEEVRALVHHIRPPSDDEVLLPFTRDIVRGDVRDAVGMRAIVQNVTCVYHLAAMSHLSSNRELYDNNVAGTRVLVEASLAAGVKRFILVSSVAAVGHNRGQHNPMTEDAPPRSCYGYGRSRLLSEQVVNRAHVEHGLKTTILRPCWMYGPGPGLSPRMIRFIRAIADGKAPLFGSGKNLASMTHIDNLLSVFPIVARSRKAVGQTYFIADDRPYTLTEIYQAVADALGMPLRARKFPRFILWGTEFAVRLGDLAGVNLNTLRLLGELGMDITCSIEKAKRELGYAPKCPLREGMAECVEWCQANGVLA